MEDIYYEAAHIGGSKGRYLYSSMIGNYLNNGAVHAVKNLTTPTLIIGSREMNKYALALDDYHKVNSNIEIVKLTEAETINELNKPNTMFDAKTIIALQHYLLKISLYINHYTNKERGINICCVIYVKKILQLFFLAKKKMEKE